MSPLSLPVATSWISLDAGLELIEHDRDGLIQACRDGDVPWRARDERGVLLKPPYDRWTGRVDWGARPARFEMADPYQMFVLGGRPGPSETLSATTWRVVELERVALLRHFGAESLAARIVKPIDPSAPTKTAVEARVGAAVLRQWYTEEYEGKRNQMAAWFAARARFGSDRVTRQAIIDLVGSRPRGRTPKERDNSPK